MCQAPGRSGGHPGGCGLRWRGHGRRTRRRIDGYHHHDGQHFFFSLSLPPPSPNTGQRPAQGLPQHQHLSQMSAVSSAGVGMDGREQHTLSPPLALLTSCSRLPHSHPTTALQVLVNPKPFLQGLTGKPVFIKLKWGMEYKGMSWWAWLCVCMRLPFLLSRHTPVVLVAPLFYPQVYKPSFLALPSPTGIYGCCRFLLVLCSRLLLPLRHESTLLIAEPLLPPF